MAGQYAVDDSEWREVIIINGYALFMGHLMMGVRGLGLLVITWTTVVLLGGFVSALEKKDFWCLTGITLIQTAGVFNFLLKEKLNDTVHSWWGFVISEVATFRKDGEVGGKRVIILYVLLAIQVLVFGVILCALGVVYMLGIYISAGVSLWRLIQHDLGDAGGANQRPALEVLYILAVAQGVLFGYKTIYALVTGGRRIANEVGRRSQVDIVLIEEYLDKTVAGCEKNLSFAAGRNFVTFGVDLMMQAKSNEGFIAGIKVLGGAIKPRYPTGAMVLAKYLLTRSSDSSSVIIQRLLETVGPRSPYGREIKEHVVCIVDIIARCISLEQFPRAIECLCSVVDTSEEYSNQLGNREDNGDRFKDYERLELLEEYEKAYVIRRAHRNGYPDFFLGTLRELLYQCLPCKRKKVENEREENITSAFDRLLIKAVNIIHKLVVANEVNRWILRTCVSNTVLHKIARLPSKLHRENHDPCRVYDRDNYGLRSAYDKSELQMLEQCWVLTEWLLVALTETSSPVPLLPAAAPVGEGQQSRRSEEIEEEAEGEEQHLLLGSMDGSALGSTIKRTIKDSIESTIKCVFDCLDCGATRKRQAIQILLHLSLDMSSIVKDGIESNKRRLSWILLLILCSTHDDSKYWMVPSLTYRNKNCCDFDGIRRKAREKLWDMLPVPEKHGLPSEETARESQLVGLALEDLKSAFSDVAQDISIRTHAVIIMKALCADYTRYSEVEEFLVDAIPEVVKETLIRCESKTAERQEQATDVEKGQVSHSQDNQDGCIDTQRRLRKALASLCYYGYSDSGYTSKIRAIPCKTCYEQGTTLYDFRGLLKQYV